MAAKDRSFLTKKSQVTIPKHVRDAIGIKPGDQVRFTIVGKTAVLEAVQSNLEEHFGSVKPRKKPEDFIHIRGNVEENVSRDVATA